MVDFRLKRVFRGKTVKKPELITPERKRIAKIFKTYVEKAVDELGPGYTVDLQGDFYTHSHYHRNFSH